MSCNIEYCVGYGIYFSIITRKWENLYLDVTIKKSIANIQDTYDNKFLRLDHMTKISVIIFDFDGVIIESVSVKTNAFRTLFSDYPEHLTEIIQYHKENGGVSRFEKFRYIYKNILNEDLPEIKFDILSKKFASIVFNEVIKAPFVPGGRKVLEAWYSQLPLYVVSATPEEELVRIINQRGIAHYFRKVFGAPKKKTACIQEILNLTGFPKDSVLFVGDAKNDYDAARAAGVRFIGRIGPGDEDRFTGLPGVEVVVHDLNEIMSCIKVKT